MRLQFPARPLRWLVPVLILLGLAGVSLWMFASRWRPSPTDYPVQGIDVSEDQGPIEWWSAKDAGVQFAYLRATSGAEGRDAAFAENWRGAGQAGVRRGALHVYSLCQPAAAQAGNFISTVPRPDDQLPPAVELDFSGDCPARPDRAALIGELGHFLAAIETHIGKPAILLVSPGFESDYRVAEPFPRLLWARQSFIAPWYFARPWTIWQASRLRRIDGVGTPVHWDVMAK